MVREREITVFVIDDDKSVQRALARLLGVADFHVVTFSSVNQFLSLQEWPATACVIADIRMPGIDSMLLPELLAAKGLRYPVILLTAQDTLENRSAASQAGAAAFFRKPVDDQALMDSIIWAMRETHDHLSSNRLDKGG
jgi:two-component system response regulator FixJ